MVDLLEAGDLGGVELARAEHARLAADLRQPLHQRDAIAWAGMRAMLDGRFDEAAEDVERARSLSEAARDPYAHGSYLCQRFWLALEVGSPGELESFASSIRETLALRSTSWHVYQASLALVYVRLGWEAAAVAHFQDLAADSFSGVPRDVVWLDSMTNLAEVCSFLGDHSAARLLLPLLAPYAERFVVKDRAMVCRGSVSRFLGLVAATTGQWDEAIGYLEAALAAHQGLPAPPLVARSECDLAEALMTRGRTADAPAALEHARRALALAEALGMTALAARCHDVT